MSALSWPGTPSIPRRPHSVLSSFSTRFRVGLVTDLYGSSPPQLVDVVVAAAVEHVLGALGNEHVPGGGSCGGGRPGGRAEVVGVPAGAVPPQLVDVVVAAAVEHV